MYEGDGFSATTVGKSLFHCQNAAPAMVWTASSDFWKAPLVYNHHPLTPLEKLKQI